MEHRSNKYTLLLSQRNLAGNKYNDEFSETDAILMQWL